MQRATQSALKYKCANLIQNRSSNPADCVSSTLHSQKPQQKPKTMKAAYSGLKTGIYLKCSPGGETESAAAQTMHYFSFALLCLVTHRLPLDTYSAYSHPRVATLISLTIATVS